MARSPRPIAARLLDASALAALALATPLAAQDQTTDAALEDLIPDSAVENPEAWATDGIGPEDGALEETVEEDLTELDPETPLDELPGLAIEWPDDLDLPPIETDLPEEDIQFADLEIAGPDVAFTEADVVRLNDSLTLGFPQLDPPFTERGDFVDRFEALSTIEELDSDDDNIAQLAARAREDEELLAELLRVYGFYDGRIVRSIGTSAPGEPGPETDGAVPNPTVRFDVIPGERYRFGAIDLGALGTAPDAETLRRAFEIERGDPMQSDRIETERFDLDTALGEFGYAFATIDEPQLLIDHDRDEGDLTMPVTPGGKYVFGAVTSSDEDFLSGDHLATIARFDPGDIYQRSLELDLRRAITATGLVSSVTITPREIAAPEGDEPGVVAMDVGIERADLRTIAGAIGYGSEEGVRVAASWEHRNLFPPEGALRVRGILGTQEQLLGVGLRKNNFGGRDRILSLDAYASTIDSPAFDANTAGLVATYERRSTLLFQKPISWSIGMELVASDERPPAVGGVAPPRSTYLVAAIPGYVP
ncbi:MAG: outer membrane protein assembly factor, partial [Erythrobacter sp.]|nr:outer membrane protein assembly factor [Erythrobacter sp.]